VPIVFDDIERDRGSPAKPGETHFSYLNRATRIEAERVRALVEDWISRYPEQHRAALVKRLRSTIDSAHYSAFFELALHELLLRTGHTILAVEPQVPNSPHQPDLLVQASDGTCFYLEAVISMNETPQEAAADARLNDAVRIVDEADARLHFLDLQIEGTPAQPVTLRRLRKALARWIAGLPATEEAKDAAAFVYEEHGMTLTVSAFLRSIPRQEAGRAIGAKGMEPYWGMPGDGIRESVEKKASRYGTLDAPYIVAINAMAQYQDEEDAIDAMFGSPCVVIRTCEDGRVEHRADRDPDGVWWGDRGPRKNGLSAILSTERLYPWSVGQRRACLVRNPWATNPLPAVSFDVDERNPVEGRLTKVEGAVPRRTVWLAPRLAGGLTCSAQRAPALSMAGLAGAYG
jgi:hypothetical protein